MVALFLSLALASFTLTRGILIGMTGRANLPVFHWPGVLLRGLWFDAATLAYAATLLIMIRALIPAHLARWKSTARLTGLAVAAWILFLLTLAVFEVVFWLEFSTRFNFIALDYLIYTQEVVRNIWQSYPVIRVFAVVIAVSAVLAYLTYARWIRHRTPTLLTRRQRSLYVAGALLIATASYSVVDVDDLYRPGGNAYAEELSGNGLFTLASAARHNALDYDRFYATIPEKTAHACLKRMHVEWDPNEHIRAQDRWGNDRPTDSPPYGSAHPRHIILVSVESLSASYLGAYGSAAGLTPRLDRLAAEGLLFKNVYATGTRTVRGLEALSLGTPPIPGQAVIRRPNNTGLSTMGEMLQRQGIVPYFIYGGYSYFDNMDEYFTANRYQVLDRTDFASASVPFENVWGVADEALYDNTITALDRTYAQGKPFFAHIMTTSNHRPYTYPAGRIDIPSPGGRHGAVKYTDYALGRFIDQCRKKPWFNETLFVLTADHCASVAGKSDLPVSKYRIPLIFYAPSMIKPGHIDRMISQIDVPPTLIAMFGVAGDDNFFGKEIQEQTGPARAFISNYQALGYYKNNQLVVLKPKRRVEAYKIDPKTYDQTPCAPDPQLVEEAITYYQTSSRAFKHGDLRLLWN